MVDGDSALILGLATFGVACIAAIGQLLAELRRARHDVAAERRDLIDEQRRRKETEKFIDELQRESQRMQHEVDTRSNRILKQLDQYQKREDAARLEAMHRAVHGAKTEDLRRRLYNQWALTHDGLSAGVLNGTEPLPDEWVRQQLAAWGFEMEGNPTRRPRFFG